MRQFKRLIVFVIILVVLLVGLFLVNKFKTNDGSSSTSFTDLCVSKQSDINQFTIENDNIKYVFMPDAEGQWGLVEPDISVKDTIVDSILAEITEIRIKEKIADSSNDLSQYGLDKGIKIAIDFKENDDRQFILGDALFDNQGYYFMEVGKDEIYSIAITKGEVLSYDFSAMLNTTLADFSEEGLGRIVVSKKGKLIYDLNAVDNQYWQLVRPIKADVKTTIVEDTLEYNLVEVSAYVDSITSKSVLKKYGLDKPSYSVRVCGGGDSDVSFDLGITDSNGLYYGRLKGEKYVFKIDTQTIPFIDLTVKDLILQFVDFRMIEDLKELSVTVGKNTDTFEITHEETTNKNGEEYMEHYFTYKGVDITNLRNDDASQYFSEIYTGFVSIPWVELDYYSEPKLKKPDVLVEYITQDGNKHVLQYQRKNSATYYVFKNGEFANLLVSKDDIEFALDTREKFLEEYKRRFK